VQMRLVMFSDGGPVRLGIEASRQGRNGVLDASRAQPDLPASIVELLAAGDAAMDAARRLLVQTERRWWLDMSDIALHAPVPVPGKLLCLGHNYFDHMATGNNEPPDYPTFFCKTANTVIGPGQPIVVPASSSEVDYEAELAVVIGRRVRHVRPEQALAAVGGYTIFNDVSARDYARRTSQWMIGKSFDTFGPMGPALVTADEIPDPQALDLSLTLNGREMQRTNTRHMIFPIAELIVLLSEVMTLEPGDVISTGTPAKTDLARSLPPFMKPGDVVCISVSGIGELSNPLVADT
jgi:acylpyruvate hydrolase